MNTIRDYIPSRVNTGPWLTAHTLDHLRELVHDTKIVLPICSLGTPAEQLTQLAPLVLPPLYHEALYHEALDHEALDAELKPALLDRIRCCFPFHELTRESKDVPFDFEIVELPPADYPTEEKPRILAFSVDTAVEEHGPHLPLATDTIQSYAVLQRLADEFDGLLPGPPVEYGHLTWGLPFGFSIDITPPLLTRYVTGFTNAVLECYSPQALYVVDVHGSIVHRRAIQEGLAASRADRYAFRWLHEPLVEFAGDRGDQHAGGVETALIEYINSDLTDQSWWPGRVDDLATKQMGLEPAVALSSDLATFVKQVETENLNGIVGNIRNYFDLDAAELMQRMLDVAREDVQGLL